MEIKNPQRNSKPWVQDMFRYFLGLSFFSNTPCHPLPVYASSGGPNPNPA